MESSTFKQVSHILPEKYEEQIVRLIYKDKGSEDRAIRDKDSENQSRISAAFERWCDREGHSYRVCTYNYIKRQK